MTDYVFKQGEALDISWPWFPNPQEKGATEYPNAEKTKMIISFEGNTTELVVAVGLGIEIISLNAYISATHLMIPGDYQYEIHAESIDGSIVFDDSGIITIEESDEVNPDKPFKYWDYFEDLDFSQNHHEINRRMLICRDCSFNNNGFCESKGEEITAFVSKIEFPCPENLW